ncbi:AAA family ATPase [Rhizobium leguminosarum]|uniref:AAA family ATPase n=1 Tax=Rhizobium leguminosarum TaxID=384 RepID=UPI001C93FA3A|nr:AAA family ATPase [Rhizobium leguminosarum]MBY5587696.1 AAA family ATPase [Rhizobium leguminosarum]
MTTTLTSLTVAKTAYARVIKAALRRSGAFLNAGKSQQFIVILRVPPGGDIAFYSAGAAFLIRSVPDVSRFKLLAATANRKGVVSLEHFQVHLDSGESLIVLWPSGSKIPPGLSAASDRIVELGQVQPEDLITAVEAVYGGTLNRSDAEQLLRFPIEDMFASLRAGRPIGVSLEKLKALHNEAPPSGPPPTCLEELEGYGAARLWGMDLAGDIAAWKRGEIPWKEVDRGILLSGPPGSGKTLFASALAQTCGIEIVATSVSRWLAAGYLGDVLTAMRKSFQEAEAKKPSILFVDELDGIGDRATFREHRDYWTQVVNLMLELVDGYDRAEGVVLVGATNHPERIDPALRRAGRLDHHVAISLPDAETRRWLCRRYLSANLSSIDLDRISASTVGFSGADFEKLGRDVRRQARRAGREISASMVMDLLPPAVKITGSRRRTVAVHEAGHAIVGLVLELGELIEVVVHDEVRLNGAAAGHTVFTLDDVERDRQTFLNQIAMLLGGRLAEEVILGTAYEGAGGQGSDINKAADLATFMDVQLGMGEELGYFSATSPSELEGLRKRVPAVRERVERALLKQWQRARMIVEQHVEVIELIASELEATGRIGGQAVKTLLYKKRRRR